MLSVVNEDELRSKAGKYVMARIARKGGWREACKGFWHKTGPALIGQGDSFSVLRVLALLVRILLLVGGSIVPILIRKVTGASPYVFPKIIGVSAVIDAVLAFDATDAVLGVLAVAFMAVPKMLDARAKTRALKVEPATAYSDLAAAIELMPHLQEVNLTESANQNARKSEGGAIRHCLSALKIEIAELIGDIGHKKLTDVVLLEFADPEGKLMQVRARTSNDPTHRPCESFRFMAYYTLKFGRWFVEHDFLHSGHPFPKKRLTIVSDATPVNYRSVLYLPIFTSETCKNGKGSPEVIDFCLGVICVHSEKPYRFWRWGDHTKEMSGMGDVAYQRALPYIALITRLIERTAPKVKLENTHE